MILRSSRKARAILVKDLRLAKTYAGSFARSWFSIVGEVIMFYFVAKLVGRSAIFGSDGKPVSYFDYVAVNLAFLRFQGVAIDSFQRAVRGDQMIGTIESILVTPTTLPLLIASSSLWPFLRNAVQIAIFLGVATLLGLSLAHVNVLTVLAFLLLTILATSPLGIIAAASIVAFKQHPPTSVLVGGFASLLGGTLFPVSKLPHWLQSISALLPITHSLSGIRGAVNGASLWTLRGDALWLAALAVVLLPVSLIVFAFAVRRAKLDGSLGEY